MFKRRGGTAVLCAAVVAAVVLGAAAGSLAEGIEAISKASEDITLSFVRPGRVATVLVKEGDSVRAGQVLMEQDNEEAAKLLEKLRAQAENTTGVELYKAQLAQKEIEARRQEDLFKKGATTGTQVERAKVDALTIQKYLEQSMFEREQSRLEYEQALVTFDRMRLKSPVDGRVEQLLVHAGEGADGLQKVVRVVKTDPLWIDVPVPLAAARDVSAGAKAAVEFPAGVAWDAARATVEGRVIFVATVADAASDTVTVRVEVPNTTLRPAGEHVRVTFPFASGAGGAKGIGGSASSGTERKGEGDGAEK